MKKKIIYAGIGIGIALLIVSVYLGLSFRLPVLAGIEEINLDGLEDDELRAHANAKIYNPNFYSLSAQKLHYVIAYHDTLLGTGDIQTRIHLNRNDTTLLELPVRLELTSIFAVHKSLLREKKCQLQLYLEGEFSKLNYHHSLDFDMDLNPQSFLATVLEASMSGEGGIKLEELTWKTSGLKSTELAFVTVIKNPLDLEMKLTSLNIKLFKDDNEVQEVGEWKLKEGQIMKANYSTRMPGSIQIQHLAVGGEVLDVLFKGEMRFPAKGLLVIELAGLPFEIPMKGTVVVDPKTGIGSWEVEK